LLLDNIFASLLSSGNFFSIVFPHLDEKYFSEKVHSKLFTKIKEYSLKHQDKVPRIPDLKLLVEMDNNISEADSDDLYAYLDSLKTVERVTDEKLLIEQTESYVQQRALEISVLSSVEIIQDPKRANGEIEDVIKAALSIEFEVKIGHDYFDKNDVQARIDSYMEDQMKIPLDIDLINTAMGGGLVRKALFILLANTNVGKTVWLCHLAASLIRSAKNVLFVSAEMGFEEIGKRVDSNILAMDINSLSNTLDKTLFISRIEAAFKKTHGNLIIKEYAAGYANAKHLRNLLNEIRVKKGYLPDVLILDHLTLFSSYRLPAAQTGTHTYVMCVAEEIRAVAKEFNIVILTAAQFNRGAKAKGSEAGSEDVGLGYGISQTADWSGAINQTPEMKAQNKYVLKVTKTRFGSNNESYYTIGINYNHMTLMNLDASEQEIPVHMKDKLKYDKEKNKEKEKVEEFTEEKPKSEFEGWDFN
jgi:archaellum biogenesis ATPase FlaH